MSLGQELRKYWGPEQFWTDEYSNERETKFCIWGITTSRCDFIPTEVKDKVNKLLHDTVYNTEIAQETAKRFPRAAQLPKNRYGYATTYWTDINDIYGQEAVYEMIEFSEGVVGVS